MKSCRIHIMGASGAGVTSLGRALAGVLALPHHDTDDYFWLPTIPPYREMRQTDGRLRLMREVFLPRAGWILSGSLNGWGDPLIPDFDLVVFVVTPREIRLQRLRAREATLFGADAIAPGGWRHHETEKFFDWAARYDDNDGVSRNLAKHQAWLAALSCPVLRVDGSYPIWWRKSVARWPDEPLPHSDSPFRALLPAIVYRMTAARQRPALGERLSGRTTRPVETQ